MGHCDAGAKGHKARIATTAVAAPAEELVASFTSWLETKGITIYNVVNHGRDMRDHGAELPLDAWTVIFGNPKLGASMLSADPNSRRHTAPRGLFRG